MYWLSVASQQRTFCWKQGDLYPQGAAMSPTCTTYFIKSKSSLIKGIIILCTKKEKKVLQIKSWHYFLKPWKFYFLIIKKLF